MEKRYVILLLSSFLILCLISNVFAYEVIFNDWVESGKSIKLGDYKIKPIYNERNMIINIGDTIEYISEEKCMISRPFKICYNDTQFLIDGDVVPDDMNSDDMDTEMKLEIFGLIADLELTRTFENETILINQDVLVEVLIENIGDEDATEVSYSDDYPASLKVSDADGCEMDDNEITWEGMIREGQIVECSYTLTGRKENTFSSIAELEYYNGMDEEKTTDNTKLIIPEPLISIELDMNSSKTTPGGRVILDINLTNNHESPVEITRLDFILPVGLEVVDAPDFTKDLDYSGMIEDTLDFSVILESVMSGRHLINLSISFETGSVRQWTTKSKSVESINYLVLELNGNMPDIRPNTEGELSIDLFNPGTQSAYQIKTEISSDIPGFKAFSITKDEIGKKNQVNMHKGPIISESEGDYHIDINTSYENSYSETFRIDQRLEFTVTKDALAGVNEAENTDIEPDNVSISGDGEQEDKFKLSDVEFDLSGKSNKSRGLLIIIGVIVATGLLFYLKRLVSGD